MKFRILEAKLRNYRNKEQNYTRAASGHNAGLCIIAVRCTKFVLTSSGSLRPAKMFPFSLGFCLLGLFSLGDVSRGGGGGGGGGATLSLVGEIVSSNHSPKMGSLSSSAERYESFIWISLSGGEKCLTRYLWGGSGVIKRQNVKSFKLVHDTYSTVQAVDKS